MAGERKETKRLSRNGKDRSDKWIDQFKTKPKKEKKFAQFFFKNPNDQFPSVGFFKEKRDLKVRLKGTRINTWVDEERYLTYAPLIIRELFIGNHYSPDKNSPNGPLKAKELNKRLNIARNDKSNTWVRDCTKLITGDTERFPDILIGSCGNGYYIIPPGEEELYNHSTQFLKNGLEGRKASMDRHEEAIKKYKTSGRTLTDFYKTKVLFEKGEF